MRQIVPTDAHTDRLAAALVRVGLVETYAGDEGRIAYRHTPLGGRLWRMLAMSDPADGQAVLDALLEDLVPDPPSRGRQEAPARWSPGLLWARTPSAMRVPDDEKRGPAAAHLEFEGAGSSIRQLPDR